MGTYIDSSIWDDRWFIDLSRDSRTLFFQILSLKMPPAGIFLLTDGKIIDMKFSKEEIEPLFMELKAKILWDKQSKYVFIINYLKRLYPRDRIVINIAKSISKTLRDCEIFRDIFFKKYNYLLDRFPEIFEWYIKEKTPPVARGVEEGGLPTSLITNNKVLEKKNKNNNYSDHPLISEDFSYDKSKKKIKPDKDGFIKGDELSIGCEVDYDN